MPEKTIQKRYECRVYDENITLQQAQTCENFDKDKCAVYRHICSVLEYSLQDKNVGSEEQLQLQRKLTPAIWPGSLCAQA